MAQVSLKIIFGSVNSIGEHYSIEKLSHLSSQALVITSLKKELVQASVTTKRSKTRNRFPSSIRLRKATVFKTNLSSLSLIEINSWLLLELMILSIVRQKMFSKMRITLGRELDRF